MRISVIRYRGAPPAQPISCEFDQCGGSIGREADNELVLPDVERHVSRVQAQVDFDGQGFGLIDLGRNPTRVDGRELARGERLGLSGGEVITMGCYELRVEHPIAVPDDPATAAQAGRAASEDPFAVFAAVPGARPEPVASPDPFASPAPEPRGRDELGLEPISGSGSVEDLLHLGSEGDWLAGPPLDAAGRLSIALDPLALFGVDPRAAPAPAELQRDDAPLLGQTFRPQQPIALPQDACADPAAPARQSVAPPCLPARMPSTPEAELLEAFLRGVGVPLQLPDGLTPALLEQVGVVLREALQGTLDLLKARAVAKREVRAEATLIASHDNNPLKFSPDIAFALQQLLAVRSQGFMAAGPALQDAYDDLRAHQNGMMAGMRSALAVVLKRFEPAALEARAAPHRLLDRFQPSVRKARLWDLFGHHYTELVREAADDFNALFGKAFLEAYDRQGDRQQGSGDAQWPSAPGS